MRIAVISDIHGNGLALDAVLADIEMQRADLTLNLGDLLSGPLEPRRVAEVLLARNLPTVAGNHERSLLNPGERDGIDHFAREALAPHHLDWLARLPATLVVEGDIFMCHGTPRSDNSPWLDNWLRGRATSVPDEAAVAAEAEGFDYPVLLCGHTHVPRAVRLAGGRFIVNPGSVGLQMNYGAPDARYALLERRGAVWSASFRAVPYDWTAAAELAARNGFPRWRAALHGGWADADGLF